MNSRTKQRLIKDLPSDIRKQVQRYVSSEEQKQKQVIVCYETEYDDRGFLGGGRYDYYCCVLTQTQILYIEKSDDKIQHVVSMPLADIVHVSEDATTSSQFRVWVTGHGNSHIYCIFASQQSAQQFSDKLRRAINVANPRLPQYFPPTAQTPQAQMRVMVGDDEVMETEKDGFPFRELVTGTVVVAIILAILLVFGMQMFPFRPPPTPAPTAAPPTAAPAEQTTNSPTGVIGKVNTRGLNCRSIPDPNTGTIIVQLNQGTPVTVLTKNPGANCQGSRHREHFGLMTS